MAEQQKARCGCVKLEEVDYCPYHRGYLEGYEDGLDKLPCEVPFNESAFTKTFTNSNSNEGKA